MWKKIGIGLGVLIVLLGGALTYMNYRNRTLSPPEEQRITTAEGLSVRISYSRPSVRERLIFGSEDEGALQPYGKYWRLGANEATVFEFSESVEVGGEVIEAGTYGVYAFPGPDSFEIGINESWDRWGYAEPDYSMDRVRFNVPVEKGDHTEQFTIQLGESNEGVRVICTWDNVRFVIPVQRVE